ncbi:hypothetical protein [Streptomyces sp. H27-D2]|uniref:hypothetical protein n=1 Tax=Streptomyces sp. H27-D2 TaxID=3046304 RepID=UPI002DC006AB|nr:hypothetical protein [Streptomyces sp. H27-D2]MEC4015179.1 hypothetical protein [Streptomyces sp. H27-D2]
MGPVRTTLLAAALAVAACAGVVNPAHAAEDPVTAATVYVSPATVAAGGEVELRIESCEGTAGRTGVVRSKAFVADARLAPDADGLFAEATVRSALKPGSYPVTADCDGVEGVAGGTLVVVRRAAAHRTKTGAGRTETGAAPAEAAADEAGAVAAGASPTAPVRAGGGGTASQRPGGAAVSERTAGDASPGTARTAGLVMAGGAALALLGLALHRRRRSGAAER